MYVCIYIHINFINLYLLFCVGNGFYVLISEKSFRTMLFIQNISKYKFKFTLNSLCIELQSLVIMDIYYGWCPKMGSVHIIQVMLILSNLY